MKRWVIVVSALVVLSAAAGAAAWQRIQAGRTDGAGGSEASSAAAPAPAVTPPCGKSSGGPCCPSPDSASGTGSAVSRAEEVRQYLLWFYGQRLGPDGLAVRVEDKGCHQEATVEKHGKLVDRLSVEGNRVTRLEG